MIFKRAKNPEGQLLISVILASTPLLAQHVHSMSASGTGSGLPVIADGSKNPQSIPDALAYEHFFSAFAAHPTPTAQEQSRQTVQLTPLQLTAADLNALTGILANFRVQLDQIESAVAAATAPSQLSSLQTQKSTLAAATLASLQQTLTADGVSRVNKYVQTRVKAHIKIYGGAM